MTPSKSDIFSSGQPSLNFCHANLAVFVFQGVRVFHNFCVWIFLESLFDKGIDVGTVEGNILEKF